MAVMSQFRQSEVLETRIILVTAYNACKNGIYHNKGVELNKD